MNPVRKRFFGDTVVAQRYTGEALVLLSTVHDQKRLGGIGYHTLSKTLANGVELTAISAEGHDEVHVRVTTPTPAARGRVRSYCVWEADYEKFSAPVQGLSITGPATADGVTVYLVGASEQPSPGVYEPMRRGFLTSSMVEASSPSRVTIPGDAATFTDARLAKADITTGKVYDIFSFEGNRWTAGSGAAYGTVCSDGDASGDRIRSTSSYGIVTTHAQGPFANQYINDKTGEGYFIKTALGPGAPSAIDKVGLVGASETIAMPNAIDTTSNNAKFDLVVTGGGTLWLYHREDTGSGTGTPGRLFVRAGGVWQEVTVDGGFGDWNRHVSYMTTGNEVRGANLLHDPITDAVCVIKSDLSGAWIFNGKDCNNEPIGSFFREFKSQPTGYAIPTEIPGADFAHGRQFFNGVIYIGFHQYVSDGAPVASPPIYSVAIGAYKVGKLLQKKQTVVE